MINFNFKVENNKEARSVKHMERKTERHFLDCSWVIFPCGCPITKKAVGADVEDKVRSSITTTTKTVSVRAAERS